MKHNFNVREMDHLHEGDFVTLVKPWNKYSEQFVGHIGQVQPLQDWYRYTDTGIGGAILYTVKYDHGQILKAEGDRFDIVFPR